MTGWSTLKLCSAVAVRFNDKSFNYTIVRSSHGVRHVEILSVGLKLLVAGYFCEYVSPAFFMLTSQLSILYQIARCENLKLHLTQVKCEFYSREALFSLKSYIGCNASIGKGT